MEDESTHSYANGDSAAYWRAAEKGELTLQQCADCSAIQFPPRHQCGNCWSEQLVGLKSSGRGVIESVTVVRRAPLQEFRNLVPYAIAAVKCDEGPRLITNIVGEQALSAAIGDAVEVCFSEDAKGNVLPRFQLAGA